MEGPGLDVRGGVLYRMGVRCADTIASPAAVGLPAHNVQVGHWQPHKLILGVIQVYSGRGVIVVEPLVARRRIHHWLLRSHLDLM